MKNNYLKSVWCLALMMNVSLLAFCQDEGSYGFRWIKELNLKEMRPYANQLAAFMSNSGKWGYLDISGTMVIPPVYEEVLDFHGGYACAKKDEKWGIIKSNGEISVDFIYDDMSDFYQDMVWVTKGRDAFYIKADGSKIRFSGKYDYFPFSEGMAKIKSGMKYGYINAKGKVVIRPRYSEASDFSGGYARVVYKREPLCINKKGRVQNYTRYLEEPLVFENGFSKIKTIRGYQYINRKLKTTMAAYKEASDYSEDLAFVTKKSGKFFITSKGKVAFPIYYENCGDFHDGKAWFYNKGKYGYIDKTGKEIIQPVFSMAGDFGNGVAYVEYEGKKGIIRVNDGADADVYSELMLSAVTLKDQNENYVVEAGELFSISVTVFNSGLRDLENVQIHLICPQEFRNSLSFTDTCITLPKMASRMNEVVTFNGRALPNLQAESFNLDFSAQSISLLSAVHQSMEIKAKGIHSKPVIAVTQVNNTNTTPLVRGELNFLFVKIINQGTDTAKNILMKMEWPEGFVFESDQINVPDLSAGDSTILEMKFIVDASLPMVDYTINMSVTDYTGLNKDDRSLTFGLAKVNPIINYLTGDTTQVEMGKVDPIHIYVEERSEECDTCSASSKDSIEANKPELLQGLDSINGKALCKYALVIGNENYADGTVPYAQSSASTFVTYCDRILGISTRQITYLQDATKEQIQAEINKMTKLCQKLPNQIEWTIYYVGRSQYRNGSCYLMPVGDVLGMDLNTLYVGLANSRARKINVILDADYTGRNVGTNVDLKGNMVVMTSNAYDQKALDYPEKEQRLFSYFLMKAMKESYGRISVADLYKQVKESFQKINSTQVPELWKVDGNQNSLNDWNIY